MTDRTDDFFDRGGDRPEIVAGRYRLPHPETGEEQSWTRATTHAELPEDSYALTRWQLRQLLLGLRRRPDLLRLIESWADEPGRDELDQVITTAHEVAGNDERANLGTAVHGVLQQVDRQWPEAGADDEWADRIEADAPEWARTHVAAYVAELRRMGLRPISSMTERRVINLDLGCAGTIDNLYEEADQTLVLGDKKTGRLDYPERKYAIQVATYHGADYLLDPDGGPPIDMRSLGLRRDYAILVYVDAESGACSIYRVDVRRGQVGANVAAQVREWRRERHLLLPYVPPSPWPFEAARVAESVEALGTDQHGNIRTETGRRLAVVPSGPMVGETRNAGAEIVRWDGQVWVPVGDAVADDPGNEHSTNSTTASLGDLTVTAEAVKRATKERLNLWKPDGTAIPALPLKTEAQLMKLTKAQVQQYGRERGVTDLAHNKPQLLPIFRAAGIVTDGPPAAETSRNVSKANVPGTDPAELPAGPATTGAEDPTDPRSPAFHRARLAEIAKAESAGTLGRIHAYVTRVGGDQAWTDELTEAARVRLAQIDAPSVRKIEWNGLPYLPIDAIKLATSSQEMAQVWNLVTVGGSDESAWTPELNEAAHARLAWLDSQPSRPPSTPFGPAQ